MNELPPAPARIRIRQIAICVPDIWPVETEVAKRLEIAVSHRDVPEPPISMFNSVFPIGNTFLEILQPERASAPTQKFLKKQRGPAGYMLLLQVDDIEKARARAQAARVRLVMDAPVGDYHGTTAAAIHLHPGDTGGVLTSFDWKQDWDAWAWGGHAWQWRRRTNVVSAIVAAEISCTEPDVVGARFAEFIGREVREGVLRLEDSEIRFVQGSKGSRDRLTGIDVVATDRTRVGETHEFARTVFRFV